MNALATGSPFPYATGDRVEYRSGFWYPGVVINVRVRATGAPQHENTTATYVVSLDGTTRTVTVHDPELLRLVRPVGWEGA